ncbi:protease pro-enzyme activation domain-containing protein [Acidipila sp. EB88]|uniref:S53 family peptidase n=1 Tax=Acidipila sp. EB88 TaxID=2305226 RepID=UPI000F5EB293|nr:S53 family peptidase [Acidipila sp. EB88]RRA49229.1 hypothetical protein D1Y84_14055 [Acidipila sp. EB88]
MQVFAAPIRSGFRSLAIASITSALFAVSASAQMSKAVTRATVSVEPQAAATPIAATVWLQLHNKAALDAAVKAMYTPGAPTYQKFAAIEDLKQYAPSAADVAKVKQELAAHNLTVTGVDTNNFAVHFQGKSSDFEAAFHTTLHTLRMKNGTSMAAVSTAPALAGVAVGLTRSVSGATGAPMHSFMRHPVDPSTGVQVGKVAMSAATAAPKTASPDGAYFASQCFYAPTNVTFNSGSLPTAQYTGFVYGAPVTNTASGTVAPCGYSPKDITSLFGLNAAYSQGYTGKGQTIAIIDAYGSPTIAADLKTFDSIYNLPAPDFKLLTPVAVTGTDAGWAGETTLDVEWAHAIAPDAAIRLIAAPSAMDSDLQTSLLYVIENKLANIVSNSYGQGELFEDTEDVTTWDEICELAAFEGISVHFSSGDEGDLIADEGVADVSSPANSPYATGVGGTSAGTSPLDGSLVETGWGTNITRLSTTSTVDDPPLVEGFLYGAGGGTSQYFALPSYQSAIGGTGRQVPDVSAIADPYTGVEIIETVDGVQYYESIGGTSLAAPVFSAEWALIQQKLGATLGQAAPYIAAYAKTSYIKDVLPVSTTYSVQGGVADSKGVTFYSTASLIDSASTSPFFAGLYHSPNSGSYFALSFGTDSTLPVTSGWDPVTGWGTLNFPAIFAK